jgi:hypothetical protein
MFAAEREEDFDTIKLLGAHVHKPGNFLSYKKPGFVGSMSACWLQSF